MNMKNLLKNHIFIKLTLLTSILLPFQAVEEFYIRTSHVRGDACRNEPSELLLQWLHTNFMYAWSMKLA